jgi:hypothetical protein
MQAICRWLLLQLLRPVYTQYSSLGGVAQMMSAQEKVRNEGKPGCYHELQYVSLVTDRQSA